MRPLDLEILLHYYACYGDFPRLNASECYRTINEDMVLRLGFLEHRPAGGWTDNGVLRSRGDQGAHRLTQAGLDFVKKVLAVDPPLLPRDPKRGQMWKHHKGSVYHIVGTGKLEVDLTPVVVYGDLDSYENLWVRSRAVFLDKVNGVNRFERLE
jgi:hypothetical protein